jgi:hypothetical protein
MLTRRQLPSAPPVFGASSGRSRSNTMRIRPTTLLLLVFATRAARGRGLHSVGHGRAARCTASTPSSSRYGDDKQRCGREGVCGAGQEVNSSSVETNGGKQDGEPVSRTPIERCCFAQPHRRFTHVPVFIGQWHSENSFDAIMPYASSKSGYPPLLKTSKN